MFRQHFFMSRTDRRAWRSAASLADLGELTAQWLQGRIGSRPGYVPGYGPDDETTQTPGLVQALAACNRAGYVTESSQPGLQEVVNGVLWTQREAVTGFVTDPLVLDALRTVAGLYGMRIVEHDPAQAPREDGIVVTERDGKPFTTFGTPLTARDVRRIWRGAGRQAVAEAARARQVTIAHPHVGVGMLFAALAQTFTDDQARCVRCGCTEDTPCPGGCWWVPNPAMEDLCSACGPDHLDDWDDEPRECDMCGAPYHHSGVPGPDGRYCSSPCAEAADEDVAQTLAEG